MASDIPITVGRTSPNVRTEPKKVTIRKKAGPVTELDGGTNPLKVTVTVGNSIVFGPEPLGSTWTITIDE
jgi:hypothetical protein